MTRVVFRASALADLEAMARYFDAIDREVTIRIAADVERANARLRDLPNEKPVSSARNDRIQIIIDRFVRAAPSLGSLEIR